jgi:hypothetical protein
VVLWTVQRFERIPEKESFSQDGTASGALAKICLNCFRPRNHFGGGNHFVDKPDPVGFLRTDHPSERLNLQGTSLVTP